MGLPVTWEPSCFWFPLRCQGSEWTLVRLSVCLGRRLSRLGCAVRAVALLAVVASGDILVGRLHFSPELEEVRLHCASSEPVS